MGISKCGKLVSQILILLNPPTRKKGEGVETLRVWHFFYFFYLHFGPLSSLFGVSWHFWNFWNFDIIRLKSRPHGKAKLARQLWFVMMPSFDLKMRNGRKKNHK